MMGNTLVTKQTGKSGKKVNIVYIEEATLIKKEYYISLIIDRKVSKMMLMASISGGVGPLLNPPFPPPPGGEPQGL